MSRVPVSESVLRWALDRSGRTADELVRKFPKIKEWLTGDIQPTLRQLGDFGKATFTPLGFLFLSQPPVDRLPIPHFRTIRDEAQRGPSPDLMDTVHSMQRRQAWMREFMMDEGRDPLTFVGSAREVDSIGSIAQKMREVLELDDTWASKEKTWRDALNTLRGAIETAGILIVVNGVVGNNTHRALDVEEFRGFVLVDEFAPLVFVNGSDSKAAQMFTLGHELAHVFLGSSAAFDLRGLMPSQESTEVKCNKVAAEFLVPEARLRGLWQSIGHLDDPFQAAARRFKVSELVVARRALDLGLISRTEFFDFYNMRQAFYRDLKSKKSSGGDYYNNLNVRVGKRFASAVIRATREGKLLYSEAYRLTDMHGRAFDNYAAKIGLGGL